MIDSTVGSLSPQESWDLESASKRDSIIRAEQPENNIVDLASSSTQGNVAPKLANGSRKGLGPVTPIVPPASAQPEDEDWASSCHSPTETFDPFAPGTEDLMLAPKKNAPRVLRILSPRKLDFDSCCNSDDEGDDLLLELLRKSFLALVLSSEMHPMSLFAESNLHDSSKTPTSLPLLTGIAETCPPAPMRHRASKSRKISDLTRRKLDFGSNEH